MIMPYKVINRIFTTYYGIITVLLPPIFLKRFIIQSDYTILGITE